MRARASVRSGDEELDLDMRVQQPHDKVVDFSNAMLYVGALQTILAVTTASLVSILSCSLLPTSAVSAVRGLTLSTMVGAAIVRKPFSLGLVHGQLLIFNALRPAVLLYIVTLVLEQLVHACARDAAAPSWRRGVAHVAIFACLVSGFLRARRPLQETDLPFLITAVALFAIAMLPPPAVLLAGPLCAQMTLATGAERLARAFAFSLLYAVFVYSSAPPVHSGDDLWICVMRASAASVWTLGCHGALLPLVVPQIGCVLYARLHNANGRANGGGADGDADGNERSLLMSDSDDRFDDMETGGAIRVAQDAIRRFDATEERACATTTAAEPVSPAAVAAAVAAAPEPVAAAPATARQNQVIAPEFDAFGERGLVDISTTASAAAPPRNAPIADKARMAEIAARLVETGP